ncbi:MAG: hypothetical protein WKG07_19275 [Hymenobacter sp.]
MSVLKVASPKASRATWKCRAASTSTRTPPWGPAPPAPSPACACSAATG